MRTQRGRIHSESGPVPVRSPCWTEQPHALHARFHPGGSPAQMLAGPKSRSTLLIVLNARFLAQPVSGVQRFAENITAELMAMRNDIELVAPRGTSARKDGPLSGADIHQVGRLTSHAWEQSELPLALRRQGSPLLLGLTNTNPALYEKKISTHHDITYVRYPESYSRRFRMAYGLIAPRMLATSRRILTVSQHSRADIADHFRIDASKIEVVPNAGAAPAPCQKGHEDPWEGVGSEYFLSVSSHNLHKNVARLIEAYGRYRADSGSPTRLVLVGNSVSSVFSGTGIDPVAVDGIDYLGRVSDKELRGIYAGAKAFVFPSLYEGFGIPPLEAQAHGVPVISSDAASLPEVLGDSALYFGPRDVDSMVRALARVDRDEQLRTSLVARGRINAERFSWRASALTVSRVLDEELSRG